MAPKLAQAACASIKDTFVMSDAAPLWRLYKVGEPDLWKDHHRYLHELRAKEVILSAQSRCEYVSSVLVSIMILYD